jgi:hypothetical protein
MSLCNHRENLTGLLGALLQMMAVNNDVNLQIHAAACLKSFILYNNQEIIEA